MSSSFNKLQCFEDVSYIKRKSPAWSIPADQTNIIENNLGGGCLLNIKALSILIECSLPIRLSNSLPKGENKVPYVNIFLYLTCYRIPCMLCNKLEAQNDIF